MNIDNVNIHDFPVSLAPMEDVTDIAFRIVCKRLGADILYTEFTSSEALIRDARKALRKIQVADEERPVAIQLFGGLDTSMEGAARIAEKANPDFIDINCGCWVKDVAMRGAGAGLLKDLPRFEAIVRSTVRGTQLPVTVKTRLGWDKNTINILDVARMVEDAGAKALTVHCRTRDMGHDGSADWHWLEKIKKVISIPLFGNGDVKTPQDAKRMLETGCDGVMIGRAAIVNPWIFRESRHYIDTGEILPPPDAEERLRVCIEHLRLSVKYKEEKYGVLEFRKYYSGYLKGLPYIGKLRAELMQYTTLQPILDRLAQYGEEIKQWQASEGRDAMLPQLGGLIGTRHETV
ncbi:MAG TPA: tRNA dihydrouridine synthase DusB [bacterium]|nr:tRNA dihydrouridine synthase DusB [bacterium]HMW35642.1 tRNA dihydrouridine synthase DusB [bacterium]HMY34629.1 tRNA dihydrouridine synthase DusB [bacterium]HMZ03818.1 tRNA dihydrouridine synthase DusB [bacterium]HNB09660.1 tRNA dihydrouridine synthase DusB [bacterium]